MKYKLDDATVVDTEKASASWAEATDWNGNNQISRATKSQWHHERLYRSARGRYYLVSNPSGSGQLSTAEWVEPEEAARWLLLNDHELPEDLAPLADEVSE